MVLSNTLIIIGNTYQWYHHHFCYCHAFIVYIRQHDSIQIKRQIQILILQLESNIKSTTMVHHSKTCVLWNFLHTLPLALAFEHLSIFSWLNFRHVCTLVQLQIRSRSRCWELWEGPCSCQESLDLLRGCSSFRPIQIPDSAPCHLPALWLYQVPDVLLTGAGIIMRNQPHISI